MLYDGQLIESVGKIDTCASADSGATFTIDIIIQDANDLLAFEAPLAYNKDVLKVVDREVKLFLGNSSGSQVFDGSSRKHTPTAATAARPTRRTRYRPKVVPESWRG